MFQRNGCTAHGQKYTRHCGITLAEDDMVIGADILADDSQVFTVSEEEGFGKRNNVDAYKVQRRGGKGVKNFKITPKTGVIVGVEVVRNTQELILITSNGIVIARILKVSALRRAAIRRESRFSDLKKMTKWLLSIRFPLKEAMNRYRIR